MATLLRDFDRTQEQLCDALTRCTAEDLGAVKRERIVAESLLYYQAREASHAGQIELLCQLATSETGN